jgi:hypothetical protein
MNVKIIAKPADGGLPTLTVSKNEVRMKIRPQDDKDRLVKFGERVAKRIYGNFTGTRRGRFDFLEIRQCFTLDMRNDSGSQKSRFHEDDDSI